MGVRHFLSMSNAGGELINHLTERSLVFARGQERQARPLEGKIAGIYFRRSSTRTRTSFSVGAIKLGAQIIQYGPNDLQVATGESFVDTGRVLANYLDLLVVRTNDSLQEMIDLASQDEMAVINAMSKNEHPTQAIADLVTMREVFGRLHDVHVLYMGEGNNTAVALALAVCQVPSMALTMLTPEGYGLPQEVLAEAQSTAAAGGAFIEQFHGVDRLPARVDVVYTTRWQTMGEPKADLKWREKFEPFRVSYEIMSRVSRPGHTIFMHDLPALRGAEVASEVLDGPQSVAFRQARHKLSSAMAIMEWCLDG